MTSHFDLGQNPFCILGARLDSTAEEVVELCQDGVLEGRFDEATAARIQQALIAPRLRLDAEVGWNADASPEDDARWVNPIIDGGFDEALAAAKGATPLARANAAAHLSGRFINRTEPLSLLIDSWNEIDRGEVLRSLEAARTRARIPRPNSAHLDEALRKLQGLHARQAVNTLQAGGSGGIALTTLVEKAIKSATLGPMLSTIVRDYDRSTEPQLAAVQELIEAEMARVRSTPSLAEMAVNRLEELLDDWDAINQPVQLLEQAEGHEEQRSRAICHELRDLAIWLANEKLLHREALALTKALLHTFPELDSVTAQLRKDLAILENILRHLPTPRKQKPLSRPQTRVASAQTQHSQNGSGSPDTGSGSGLLFFWGVGGFGVIVIFAVLISNNTPTTPVAPRSPTPAAITAAQTPQSVPTAPAPAQEVAPPTNPARALTTAELRYCEFQGARLDHMRSLAVSSKRVGSHFVLMRQ